MEEARRTKIIGIWLVVGVGMILGQVMLGGITRLTGSGLSITEWNAIMGFLPPLNLEEWTIAFEKYKQYDQFKLVNTSMTLDQFKDIFFWEWFHRNWARFLNLVFVFPLTYFIVKKIVRKQELPRILFIMVLGALAGVAGWLMVDSGLQKGKVLVHPVKLMIHLLIATATVIYVLRLALEYLYPKEITKFDIGARKLMLVLVILVLIQIALGALVAGSKAALACTTWPLMNGEIIPTEFGFHSPWNDFLYQNNLSIQFVHRMVAYLVFFYVLFIFFKTRNVAARFQFHRTRWLLLTMVFIQLLLGIFTLIYSDGKVPVTLGVLHQLGAFLVLIFSVEGHYFIKYRAK